MRINEREIYILRKLALAAALCIGIGANPSAAQVTPNLAQNNPPITMAVDVENFVVYTYDVIDSSKYATDPGGTTSSAGLQQGALRTFTPIIGIADIVAVNGLPAKGTWISRGIVLNLQTSVLPGRALADIVRSNITDQVFEILSADGTPIGTIMASELGFGTPPPGSTFDQYRKQ